MLADQFPRRKIDAVESIPVHKLYPGESFRQENDDRIWTLIEHKGEDQEIVAVGQVYEGPGANGNPVCSFPWLHPVTYVKMVAAVK